MVPAILRACAQAGGGAAGAASRGAAIGGARLFGGSTAAADAGPSGAAALDDGAALTLDAEPRAEAGSLAAARLRKAGRTPGVLFSLPGGGERLLSFDAAALARVVARLGRARWACTEFDVRIRAPGGGGGAEETVRALGRQAHLAADTGALENVTLLHCPPGRRVRVAPPVRAYGEEACPGIKAGGRINWVRRDAPCVAAGGAVPQAFEVDVSRLPLGGRLTLRDLAVPDGVRLAAADLDEPILKIVK